MRPQDIVAILLTVGVLLMLLSGTYIRCIWMECNDLMGNDDNEFQFWHSVMNIVLGGLIGYIAGRENSD